MKHTWNTLENAKISGGSLGCFGKPPNPIIFFRVRDHHIPTNILYDNNQQIRNCMLSGLGSRLCSGLGSRLCSGLGYRLCSGLGSRPYFRQCSGLGSRPYFRLRCRLHFRLCSRLCSRPYFRLRSRLHSRISSWLSSMWAPLLGAHYVICGLIDDQRISPLNLLVVLY